MVGMRLIRVSTSVHRSERNLDRPSRAAAPKATPQLDRLQEGGDLCLEGTKPAEHNSRTATSAQALQRSALLPSGTERVTEGQQFDEIERQQKNPDGSPRAKDESLLRF
jgi:hypothetical protein